MEFVFAMFFIFYFGSADLLFLEASKIPPALWAEVVLGSCLISIPLPHPLPPPWGRVPRPNTAVKGQSFALYRSFAPQQPILSIFGRSFYQTKKHYFPIEFKSAPDPDIIEPVAPMARNLTQQNPPHPAGGAKRVRVRMKSANMA